MPKPPRPVIAWTVGRVNPRGPWIVPQYCSYTRRDAIDKVLEMFRPGTTWKKLKKDGWFALKVRVEAV